MGVTNIILISGSYRVWRHVLGIAFMNLRVP